MTKQEYMSFHEDCCRKMVEITRQKNHDYTGTGDDPFANFRKIGALIEMGGIDVNEIGFLTRMSDKFSRIGSFVEKGAFQVKDESFLDTCLDLANYCVLLAGYHISKGEKHDNKLQHAGRVYPETSDSFEAVTSAISARDGMAEPPVHQQYREGRSERSTREDRKDGQGFKDNPTGVYPPPRRNL